MKIVLWTLTGLIGLVALTVFLLYMPFVQDFAVPRVLKAISKPGEMEISVSRFRLRFPLNVEVDSLDFTTPGMAVQSARAKLGVSFTPLLSGEIMVPEANLQGTNFRLGTPDSAMYMTAALQNATLKGARVHLEAQRVRVSDILMDSGLVVMTMRPDTVARPMPNDSVPVNWHVTLDHGKLSNIAYRMSMFPTISDLDCSIADGDILDADVDMRYNTVKVKEIAINRADARYIYPTPAFLAANPVPPVPADTTATVPWTVTCDRISLTDSKALYALEGARPIGSNFDLDYIQASEINIQIDSFLNRGTTVHAPIRRISARERCGVPLELTGLFDMDSIHLEASDMRLTTPSSEISLTAMMGLTPPPAPGAETPANGASGMDPDTPFSIDLDGQLSNDDIRRLTPTAFAPIANGLPRGVPVSLTAIAKGTMSDINVKELSLEMPNHLYLEASGHLRNAMNLSRAVGDLTLIGNIPNAEFLKPTLMDAKLARTVSLPPMTLDGTISLDYGNFSGDIEATAADGSVALTADWRNHEKGYDLTFDADKFPLQKILPSLGISDISASAEISGQGIDPKKPATALKGNIQLIHIGYKGQSLKDITLDANISDGLADIILNSGNAEANLTVRANGNIDADTLRWNLDADIRNLDFAGLHISDSIGHGSVNLTADASFALPRSYTVREGRRRVKKTTPLSVDADLDVKSLYWKMQETEISTTDLLFRALANADTVSLSLDNHDLRASISSSDGLDSLMAALTNTMAVTDTILKRRNLDIPALQRALPPFSFDLDAGNNNILTNFIAGSGMKFDTLAVALRNDSLISGDARLLGFVTGKTRLDTIALNLQQVDSTLIYKLSIENAPGTFDQFAHISARGYIGSEKFALLFNQQNIQEETGFSFGSVVTSPYPGVLTLRFVPYHPVIGYKSWEINRDNFVSYNLRTSHFDANIDLHNSASSLKLFTQHNDSDSAQEAIRLQLNDIKLQDWLAINPFAPPMKGDLSADMSITLGDKSLDGDGTVGLKNFYYGNDKVADFDLELALRTNAAGTIRANTTLLVDGVRTITASGNLNDSTATNPFMLDFRMIHFPLSVANPFLPRGTAKLHGMLNGEMDITGNLSQPVYNGWVQFDSTAVDAAMLGTSFVFSDEKIPVENSLVSFNKFAIKAANENPLILDGTVDISSFSLMKLDLGLTAKNTQIIGSKRKRGQDAYGKAYINLDAKVKGTTSFLDIDASLKVLPGTNCTYIIPDVQSAIQNRSRDDMVKFVNFADTAAVAQADSIIPTGMLTNINASLEISEGSTIAVDLSADGKNRAQVQPSGRVNYSLDYLGDERCTGRININDGFVRYSMPPVLSEKLFHFQENSYVVFNGQMLNPVLNIKAYDEVKATVNNDGNSKIVNFDVNLAVGGTLENMNVVFSLSTDNDLTIENEIQSMSPDQKANQAMNLLLYGTYTGPGTKASQMGNPLYTFLEGQLNNLASSAIKGVDISFGIDQLERNRDGVNSTAMNYSYQVSKSLFDDRFKIVVGGNYTTDANADENFSQNLISDISFEYMLNRQGTKYIRLFRHTGYESILEGEITQTGVGFVWKRKLRTIHDLFNWLPWRKEPIPEPDTAVIPDEPDSSDNPDTPDSDNDSDDQDSGTTAPDSSDATKPDEE